MARLKPAGTALHYGPGKPAPQVIVHSVLLAILLAVFLLASTQVRAYADGVTRDSFTLEGTIPTPVLKFTPPAEKQNGVVAVIAHGYASSKEMMSAFAVDLAREGITTYTFDLPGHGASTVPYGGPHHVGVVDQLITALGEVVDYALANAPTSNPKLVLIGYSLGTIAVGGYALEHPDMASLQATVLVAGILKEQPTATTPRNLLVLSGQFDLPGINDTSRQLIASACNVPPVQVTGISYQCQMTAYNARERIILPGLDHISIVTAASTHDVVLTWLHDTVSARIGTTTVNADVRLHWMLIGFLAAILALVPFLRLGAIALEIRSGPRHPRAISHHEEEQQGIHPAVVFGLLTGVLLLGLAILRGILPTDFWAPEPFPFGFLRQQVSADVAMFFLYTGIILLLSLRLVPDLRRQIVPLPRHEIVPQVLLAAGATAFLTITLGGLSSYAWESLELEPQRLWRGAVYAVMVWPFFFGLRSLLFAVGSRVKFPALMDLGASLLIIASLGGAIALNFERLAYLGILLPIVAIMLLILAGLGTWVRHAAAQPVMLTATLEAFLLAWILSATLPLIA